MLCFGGSIIHRFALFWSVIHCFAVTGKPHVFMLRVSKAVLDTKIEWFDPYMRGDLIPSEEVQRNTKNKRILYTNEEKQEISEEAQSYFEQSCSNSFAL